MKEYSVLVKSCRRIDDTIKKEYWDEQYRITWRRLRHHTSGSGLQPTRVSDQCLEIGQP